MGAYHTIELELNRKFTLAKKSWDSVVLDRIGKQVLKFGFQCVLFGKSVTAKQKKNFRPHSCACLIKTRTSHLHANQDL